MSRSGRLVTIVAFASVAFAFAYPMQVNAWNQNAHYALVRALADGTPTIDKSADRDRRPRDGRRHARQRPLLLEQGSRARDRDAARVRSSSTRWGCGRQATRRSVIWVLHLWAIALPALLLSLLVRYVGDGYEPGYGLDGGGDARASARLCCRSRRCTSRTSSAAALHVRARSRCSSTSDAGRRGSWLVARGRRAWAGFAATTEYTAGDRRRSS